MRRTLLLPLLALLAACAGTGAPVGSADDMAFVQASDWGKVYRGGRLRIGALNAKPMTGLDASQTYLAPGPQSLALEVLHCPAQSRQCQPIASVQVRFEAAPRRTYVVRVAEQIHGSNVFRAWVTDDTGAIVASSAP